MKPIIEFDSDSHSPEIQFILKGAIAIIEQLSDEKIDHQKTRIYEEKGEINIEVNPNSDHAVGIYMFIYEKDDIAVGLTHGAHEHFDRGYPGNHIPEAALKRFKELLFSEQTTTVISKKEKPYSWETVFLSQGTEVCRLKSTTFPAMLIPGNEMEKYTYSYL
jgi:hypothetical protein